MKHRTEHGIKYAKFERNNPPQRLAVYSLGRFIIDFVSIFFKRLRFVCFRRISIEFEASSFEQAQPEANLNDSFFRYTRKCRFISGKRYLEMGVC